MQTTGREVEEVKGTEYSEGGGEGVGEVVGSQGQCGGGCGRWCWRMGLSSTVFDMVSAVLAIDFVAHAGMHTRLSVVDYICFPPSPRPPSATSPSSAKLRPSTSETSSKVSAAPRSSCSSILPPRKMVDSNAHCRNADVSVWLDAPGGEKASIRWRFGYFKPNTFGDQ
uniref:Uncharacterized protein n=1 Tax=Oryza glumipatula TaxID=40148 RepID=A0A0E0A536_9ORYZ